MEITCKGKGLGGGGVVCVCVVFGVGGNSVLQE